MTLRRLARILPNRIIHLPIIQQRAKMARLKRQDWREHLETLGNRRQHAACGAYPEPVLARTIGKVFPL